MYKKKSCKTFNIFEDVEQPFRSFCIKIIVSSSLDIYGVIAL